MDTSIFLLGSFFALGMYHLILFIFNRKDWTPLFLSIGTISISFRTIFVNQTLTSNLFPLMTGEMAIKVQYWTEIIGFICLILLMCYRYPKVTNKIMQVTSIGYGLFFGSFVLLTSSTIFTKFMLIHVFVMGLFLVYFVLFVGIKGVMRKREDAHFYLFAQFIIIAMWNDALYYEDLIKTIPMFEYSILLFLLLQAGVISYRYSRLIVKNLELTTELSKKRLGIDKKAKEMTKKLRKKNEELVELQNKRRKMLANIAHDLGPPMLGIQTYLGLMKDGMVKEDDQEVIEQLYGKSEYVRHLIDDLFELSKLELNGYSFDMEYIKLKDFVNGVYQKFTPDLRQENRMFIIDRLETKVNTNEVFIQIDINRMMQVMQNLISNAVKFSGSAENQTIIMNCYILKGKSARGEGKEVIFEVIDHGQGIQTEEQEKVFQCFYKTNNGNHNGNGLGLPISKEIIEHHDGSIGVESKAGEGSKFYFILPYFFEAELPRDDS